MPLASLVDMYNKAIAGNYAIPQFNVNNLEFIQAAMEVAEELKSPIILAASTSAIKYAGMNYLMGMVKAGCSEVSVPVAMHLDHGAAPADAKACIDAGFTSVMIDASHEDLDNNIRITKEVVVMAKDKGVCVEAELGRLGGIEDEVVVDEKDAFLTDPAEAERFVKETGLHALAIAVGTSHGAYKFKQTPKLAMDRITEIKKLTNIALVLHGASGVPKELLDLGIKYGAELPGAMGVPDEAYKDAVSRGINKINIDTDLRLAFMSHVRQFLAENPSVFDPRKILKPAKEAIKEQMRSKIRLFGCEGKGA
ncbi:MAG: class II fructose-1,6-bisphosphate aldolase [candidate division Zixibacteria bacterium]|nr:class II fructose-1,6-bisphosphate aldolase [candidate division Zixibacteria bacterium]